VRGALGNRRPYRDQPIIHLQSDLKAVVHWADSNSVHWAFSDRNAGTVIAQFFNSLNDLDQINWSAVTERDFRPMSVRDGKQAEFLVYESFPWELVEKIGVLDRGMAQQVQNALYDATHKHCKHSRQLVLLNMRLEL